MTPARLSEVLDILRWPIPVLAEESGVNERTIRRWLLGAAPIADNVGDWLEALAACHTSHPVPRR